jgi:hypothetical protein
VDNDNSSGNYNLVNDLNGDNFVTSDDFTFIDNNNAVGVTKQIPPGAPALGLPTGKSIIKNNINK